MTGKFSINVGLEDLRFLREHAYSPSYYQVAYDAWDLLETHCDKSAEVVAAQHIETQAHRDGLRKIAHGVRVGVAIASTKFHIDWEERFQEYLNQAGVCLKIDDPSDMRVVRNTGRKDYYAQCIEYIRCGAYFSKTALRKQIEEEHAIKNGHYEMLDALRVAGYLQCDLRDR